MALEQLNKGLGLILLNNIINQELVLTRKSPFCKNKLYNVLCTHNVNEERSLIFALVKGMFTNVRKCARTFMILTINEWRVF